MGREGRGKRGDGRGEKKIWVEDGGGGGGGGEGGGQGNGEGMEGGVGEKRREKGASRKLTGCVIPLSVVFTMTTQDLSIPFPTNSHPV